MQAARAVSNRDAGVASPGATMAVDWEGRVDFDRLRTQRLTRVQD